MRCAIMIPACLLVVAASVFPAVPTAINYQGRLTELSVGFHCRTVLPIESAGRLSGRPRCLSLSNFIFRQE